MAAVVNVLKDIFHDNPGKLVPESHHSVFIEAKETEVVVTTGAARRTKLQLNRLRQQTNTRLFTGQMPFVSPNQQHQGIEDRPIYQKLFCRYIF